MAVVTFQMELLDMLLKKMHTTKLFITVFTWIRFLQVLSFHMSVLVASSCKQNVAFITPNLLIFRHLYEIVFMLESVRLVGFVNLLLEIIVERIIGVEWENVKHLEAKVTAHMVSLVVELMVIKQFLGTVC